MLATLPNECLFEIFKNLRFYNACLFSCLLVNRQLCRIIIPILWSKPKFNDKRFVLICLLTLNHEEQTQLIPFNIMLQNEPKPLFEYTSYITNFENENYNHLISGITSWLKSFKNGGNKEHELYGTMFRGFFRADRPTNAIICSLFTMFLRTSTRLKNLTFIGNIHNKIMFAESIYKNTTLTSLKLSNNDFDSEERKEILEMLFKKSTLASLEFENNRLGAGGEKILSEVLCKNITLTSLNIAFNQLGFEGMKAIAKPLLTNTTLTSLDLFANQLGCEGGRALAEVLSVNTTLTSLDIGRNELGPEGGKAIADALCTNITLTNLNLYDNDIGSEAGKAIADALYVNSSLDSLNLNSNELDTEVGKAMAKALRKNTTLTNLNLDHNQLGFKGGMALAEALCENRTLGSLSIGDNDIIDRKKSTLSRIFWNNPFLQVTFYVL